MSLRFHAARAGHIVMAILAIALLVRAGLAILDLSLRGLAIR